jgi:hydrogenase maturation protease
MKSDMNNGSGDIHDRASGRILVACIGNIFLGDDAFGVEVARELAGHNLSEEVAVVDYGIRGLDLAYALLEPWRAVVIVDAIARRGTPGDLYLLEMEPDAGDEAGFDPHSMDPFRVFALARSLGDISAPIYVAGCEPEGFGDGFEGRMGLSELVAAAVPEAARMVEGVARRLMAGGMNIASQAALKIDVSLEEA